MRRSSLISLVIALTLFSVYFLFIDPIFADNRWFAFLAFMLVWAACRFLAKKLEGRFAFLNKRIDPQLSVWACHQLVRFLSFADRDFSLE